ncbi:MAG: hypothetical protein FWD16_07345, partial [Clostridia bacterium]|nr:hypothetical protein [Clostridia bacterium]
MKTTLKKLSPVVLRLLSAACVLAMLIGMALPVWASPSDSKWEDKIEPQLRDIMNQMEDNEVVAVYLFLDSTQIMADIEAEKQALGTDYETLLAFLETQVELGVLPFYDGVDIYDATIMSHRAIVKRHMS